MLSPHYNFKNLLADIKLIDAVENSPAYDYLGEDFDLDGHIRASKIEALGQRFDNLVVAKGERMSLDDCSDTRISRALRNAYEQAQTNIFNYQEQKEAEWAEKERVWQEIRDATTIEQHLTALDGYWGQIRHRHDVSTMKRLMKEELNLD